MALTGARVNIFVVASEECKCNAGFPSVQSRLAAAGGCGSDY